MKTTRISKWVEDYLVAGPKSIQDILVYINEKSRHGTSMAALNNVLGKRKVFVKMGSGYFSGAHYRTTVWGKAK